MSAVLVAIAHVFRDFGVSSFLKQEKHITPTILSGAIGLLLFSSFFMAGLLFASSSIWAGFYGEQRVEDVIQVLAIGFLFIPLGAIPQALLMREMNVAKSAWVTLFSTVVYFVSSIILALTNHAHMTMAWANLINIIVSGIAYTLIIGQRTTWIPSTHHWRKIASFGAGNLTASILKSIDNAMPDIALGKWSNATNVGLYSRANSTVNMIATLINPTIYFFAVPFLAKTHHKQGSISNEFLHGDSIIVCLLIPPLIGIALLAEPIVMLLYGAQWIPASKAIPWLCIAAGISTLFSITAYAVTGKGRPQAVIPALMATVIFKIFSIVMLFDGTLASFAKAIAIGQMVGAPVFVWVNWRHLDIQPWRWLVNLLKPAPIWFTMGASLWIMRSHAADHLSPLPLLLVSAVIIVGMSLSGYLMTKLPIRDEMIIVFRKLFISKHD